MVRKEKAARKEKPAKKDYILEDGEVDVTDKLSNNTAESQRARDNEENSNTFIIAFPIILFISYLIALALK